jgi:hypothetical protein
MTRPKTQIVQMDYWNPSATAPLIIPVLVLCNTADEVLKKNIRENSARDLPWINTAKPHDGVAVMIGGGPSVVDCLQEIDALQRRGATVFCINGAAKFMNEYGVFTDYQVIADAKPETAQLVYPYAKMHLFASQVDPVTMGSVPAPRLWHLESEGIEDEFPPERRERGGYALVGGGAATGNSALCLAYVLGYREFHIFGYDSSHRGKESHAYPQPMNRFIPCVDVEWAGKKFFSSVAMKAQAEKFQITGQALEQAGCVLNVYGEGLLPTMWNSPPENLTERDKYRLMWQFDGYRVVSPGEAVVDRFIQVAKPEGLVVDFGCGTGRAGLKLRAAGLSVFLIDFADNCRDEETLHLPFLEWDLMRPCPVAANYGFCSDVMEHIPPDDVVTVIRNIMGSARSVFFQISTVKDSWGEIISHPLHLTVRPHEWWLNVFQDLGFNVAWESKGEISSSFLVKSS